MSGIRLVQSPVGHRRLQAAAGFLRSVPPGRETLLVGASRDAADELARTVLGAGQASFGLHRLSLLQLAVRVAAPALARAGRSPSSALGAEAVVARVLFEAVGQASLDYFRPVSQTPGFPRAVAATLNELRLAGLARLAPVTPASLDLDALLSRIERAFEAAGIADRAALLHAAAGEVEAGTGSAAAWTGVPLLLLDLAVNDAAAERLVGALARRAGTVLATVAAGDDLTRAALERALGVGASDADAESGSGALVRLRRWLFEPDTPPPGSDDEAVQLFSAPGEGRECVEIARRVLAEAARGVPFDEIAVFVRAPHQYLGLLEHAFARAGVPAWFERGTRRPDPAGRALLALLHCAEEQLSARRFAEYLSLAQVPDAAVEGDPEWTAPDDDVFGPAGAAAQDLGGPAHTAMPEVPFSLDAPVAHGALRTPWRWEALLVESAVIGGRDRWESRLAGLAEEYRRRIAELESEEPESPRAVGLRRDLERLGHLRAFALPLMADLDAWCHAVEPWGVWLDRIERLVPRVLRQPLRVLRVLAELRPMSAVGPVGVAEVRKVLAERLRTLAVEPPPRRFGRVYVGAPAGARGRAFRVVFVPGLAERIFPQKLREDPLLLDEARAALGGALVRRDARAVLERLQLRLAVGAASERVYLSYPRLEVGESRPRVPSFYALDVRRAVTGRIPPHDELQREAYQRGGATLAWPAPPDPSRAIDAFEHDLSVLRPLLDERDQKKVAGRGRYLLELNAHLGRAVRERWARAQSGWSPADGVMRVADDTREALAAQRLGARPYSLSALQQYTECPYRFLLAAIYRLAPREEAAPLQRLDPLTKGSLFHRIQAEFLREMRDAGRLPVRPDGLREAIDTLDGTIRRVGADERARLAPAIGRVWDDEMAAMARDLHHWVERMAADRDGWVPRWFEYAFGLPEQGGRDEASHGEPALVDGRFLLRGSIDLVEEHRPTGALRVTDHKTGRARWPAGTLVAGGAMLQPILYSLALESITGAHVHQGRLWYCTAAGEFKETPVDLTPTSRRAGVEVLEIVDRALEFGLLAAYPRDEACARCDFRPVCGPREEQRTRGKDAVKFADLADLRSRP